MEDGQTRRQNRQDDQTTAEVDKTEEDLGDPYTQFDALVSVSLEGDSARIQRAGNLPNLFHFPSLRPFLAFPRRTPRGKSD